MQRHSYSPFNQMYFLFPSVECSSYIYIITTLCPCNDGWYGVGCTSKVMDENQFIGRSTSEVSSIKKSRSEKPTSIGDFKGKITSSSSNSTIVFISSRFVFSTNTVTSCSVIRPFDRVAAMVGASCRLP